MASRVEGRLVAAVRDRRDDAKEAYREEQTGQNFA